METRVIASRIDDPEVEVVAGTLKELCRQHPEFSWHTLRNKKWGVDVKAHEYLGWRIRRREYYRNSG